MILPLVLPGLVSGAILIFVPVIGSFMEPRILGGRVGVTMGTVIEDQFTANVQLAARCGAVLHHARRGAGDLRHLLRRAAARGQARGRLGVTAGGVRFAGARLSC